eukprot:GHUV01019070.1.p1 GENE.GHUV01019070.1~~GHUV01019070.1.p1  ORF type:complete len:584 (+),score=148.65 GHUV01019070.1:628-2379(+)
MACSFFSLVLKQIGDTTVACFASQLEEEIAALEAKARRDNTSCCETSEDETMASMAFYVDETAEEGIDYHSVDQATDSGSDEDLDLEDSTAARIHENARMVASCGRPSQPGAWKGCVKSAWCDREDRHRGLCNHKACIPGPAACPALYATPCSSSHQHEEVLCDIGRSSCCVQQLGAALPTEGHNDSCRGAFQSSDGREVASSLNSGCAVEHQQSMETSSLPFSCHPDQDLQPLINSEVAANALPEVFWSSSNEEQEHLITMPAVYQPLVKDLDAACIGTLLGAEGLCDMDETLDVPVPVVQPVAQPVEEAVQEFSTSSGDSAYDTLLKPSSSLQAGNSVPSSPSYTSEAANMAFVEAAAFTAVSSAAMPGAASSAAVMAAPVPLPMMVAPAMLTAGSTTLPAGTFVLPGMLPLEEVHPAGMQAIADGQSSSMTGGSSSQQYEIVARLSSTGSQFFESNGVDAAVSLVQEAPQAATAADTPGVTASAKPAATAAAPKVPLMQRAPRIKVKPRRADDPPRPLLEPSSPKNKKRVAGRMAAHPTSGHCCTQCGAVSTPVWRAGPAGPKTLCNACGVRYMKVARRK